MNAARYRAWRFIFPGTEDAGQPAGICLSAKGGIALVGEAATVRQAIFLLLSTRIGERVMRPDYGCDLFKLVFAPNDDTTAGLAIHYARQALARWEPRIEQVRLDANLNAEHPNRLELDLAYRLRVNGQWDQASFSLNLQPGGSA